MSDGPNVYRSVRQGPAEAAANGHPNASPEPFEDGALGAPPRAWRRALAFAISVIIVVLVVGLALVVGPALWTAAADESVRPVDGRLIGEAAGYVAAVDRELRTIAVSRSLFGWWPIVVSVKPDTVITVQSREGAFGDLAGDMLVRVTYEVVGGTRMARSIEIGGPSEAPPSPPSTVPPARAVPATPAPTAPAPPPSASRLAEQQAAPVAMPAPPPGPAPRAAAPSERQAAPVVTPAPPPSPAPRVTIPLERLAPPASPAPAPPVVRAEPRPPRVAADVDAAPRPESVESDSADGSAAIDWLFDQRR